MRHPARNWIRATSISGPDVAILELREGTFEFLDNYKGTRTGKQRLFPVATVLAGKRVQAA